MRSYIPYGVSPAVLLPFDNDLAIDEAAFRKHLRDVAATDGISAITINAHSTEVASCTFDEQRKVLDIARDEIGAGLPLVNGIWADTAAPRPPGSPVMATAGGASALLVFPPAPFTLGQSPQMALAHFSRIAEASDLSIIVFQYPDRKRQPGPSTWITALLRMWPSRSRTSGPSRIGVREPTAARMARAHIAKPAAPGQRALDPQRLAVELARARLQRPALRQRQRDPRICNRRCSARSAATILRKHAASTIAFTHSPGCSIPSRGLICTTA